MTHIQLLSFRRKPYFEVLSHCVGFYNCLDSGLRRNDKVVSFINEAMLNEGILHYLKRANIIFAVTISSNAN